jgi:hypothetical protein
MSRLPLTLLEQYLLHDDRKSYPGWMFGRLPFTGQFNHHELQLAWAETARRHPLLASVVSADRAGRLDWVTQPGGPAPIEWRRGPLATAWPADWAPLDLTREPGFRWVIVETETGGDIFAQIHHAVVDGAGFFQVLHELLLLYTHAMGGHVVIPELRPRLLAGRGRLAPTWWGRLKLVPAHLFGLAVAWPILRRTVTPMVPHRPAAPDDAPAPGLPSIVSRRFSQAETKTIRAAARPHGAGLNELLMRDVFAALGVWRAEQGIGTPLDWIRLGLPTGLRRASDSGLPAANVFSLVGIDRRGKSLANRARLLRRAKEDMALVRKHRLDHTFLLLLGLHRWLPGGLAAYTRREACRATMVMTHLGPVCPPRSPLLDAEQRYAVPGAVIEDLQIGGLFRPGTCATLGFALYAGRLLADLHYDARYLTAVQAESFMQALEAQVRLSMAESSAAPP